MTETTAPEGGCCGTGDGAEERPLQDQPLDGLGAQSQVGDLAAEQPQRQQHIPAHELGQRQWLPDADQGDISGLSRSVSNLGSSFGTALVGSVLVAVKMPAGAPFAAALAMMLVITLIGLVLAVLLPRQAGQPSEPAGSGTISSA